MMAPLAHGHPYSLPPRPSLALRLLLRHDRLPGQSSDSSLAGWRRIVVAGGWLCILGPPAGMGRLKRWGIHVHDAMTGHRVIYFIIYFC